MSKVSIRVGSTKRIPGAKMIATHAHKKREVLASFAKNTRAAGFTGFWKSLSHW
jgi:hypothetical protein